MFARRRFLSTVVNLALETKQQYILKQVYNCTQTCNFQTAIVNFQAPPKVRKKSKLDFGVALDFLNEQQEEEQLKRQSQAAGFVEDEQIPDTEEKLSQSERKKNFKKLKQSPDKKKDKKRLRDVTEEDIFIAQQKIKQKEQLSRDDQLALQARADTRLRNRMYGKIEYCTKIEDLLSMVKQFEQKMDQQLISLAFKRVGNLRGGSLEIRHETAENLVRVLLPKINSCGLDVLERVIWSIGKCKYKPSEENSVLIRKRIMTRINDFSFKQIAHIFQGFVNLEWKDQEDIDSIKDAVINQLEGARRAAENKTSSYVDPQDLVIIAWSCAYLTLQDTRLIRLLSAASMDRLYQFEPRNLATLVRSFARLGFHDKVLMNAVANQVRRNLGKFKLTGLTKVAWSFGTLRFEHRDLFDAIAKTLMFQIDDHEMAQGSMLVDILYAFAAVKYQAILLIEKICGKMMDQLDQMSGEQMSKIMWSLGQLEHRNLKLIKLINMRMVEYIEEYEFRHLTEILQASSNLRFYDNSLFKKMSFKVQQRSGRLEAKEAAAFAWAYGLVGHYDPKTMSLLADRIVEKLNIMTFQQLIQAAWGYANLRHADDNLYEEIQMEMKKRLTPRHLPSDIVKGLWAMAVMDKFNIMFWQAMLEWLREFKFKADFDDPGDFQFLKDFYEVYQMCQHKNIGLEFPEELVEVARERLKSHRTYVPQTSLQREINRVLRQMELNCKMHQYTEDRSIYLGTVVSLQGEQIVIQGEKNGDLTHTKPTTKLSQLICQEIIYQQYGYKMVHLREREWYLLKMDQERKYYLKDKILSRVNS